MSFSYTRVYMCLFKFIKTMELFIITNCWYHFLKKFTDVLKWNSPLFYIYCAYLIEYARLFKYYTVDVNLPTQVFNSCNYSYWISTWYHFNYIPVVGNSCVKRIRMTSLVSNYKTVDYKVLFGHKTYIVL